MSRRCTVQTDSLNAMEFCATLACFIKITVHFASTRKPVDFVSNQSRSIRTRKFGRLAGTSRLIVLLSLQKNAQPPRHAHSCAYFSDQAPGTPSPARPPCREGSWSPRHHETYHNADVFPPSLNSHIACTFALTAKPQPRGLSPIGSRRGTRNHTRWPAQGAHRGPRAWAQ